MGQWPQVGRAATMTPSPSTVLRIMMTSCPIHAIRGPCAPRTCHDEWKWLQASQIRRSHGPESGPGSGL